MPAGVLDLLPAPDPPADVHDFAGAAQRRVIGHAVEALDDLRPGRADAEGEPAVGDEVQARRGHRGEGGRAGVDLQDAGGDLQAFGAGGDEAQLAHRVERVGLRDEHDVQPGLLVGGQVVDGFLETAAVVQRHPDAHRPFLPVCDGGDAGRRRLLGCPEATAG